MLLQRVALIAGGPPSAITKLPTTTSSLYICSPQPPPQASSRSDRRRTRTMAISWSSRLRCPPRCSLADVSSTSVATDATTSTATATATPSGFVEVGRLSKAHGLHGQLHVTSSTDFPDLRFCKPGRRWLRSFDLGKEVIREVNLVAGKEAHKGCWIVSFQGIDSVEKAREVVGSTMLVREDDRPVLEDGEFYTNDLIGMKVLHKETGTLVGTVVNVVKLTVAGGDLLQVKLDMSEGILKVLGSPELEKCAHGSLVWVPFIEGIVPDVDMDKREMMITPPDGLLQLNLRSDPRTKKERSRAEWKEKVKFQRQVKAAKKKLLTIGQKHILEGFSYCKKDEKKILADHILDIDYNLFQYALKNINIPRFSFSELLESELIRDKFTKFPRKYLTSFSSVEKDSEHSKLLTSGMDLVCESKVCTVLVVEENNKQVNGSQIDDASQGPDQLRRMEDLLNDDSFHKMHGKRVSSPFVIVCPANDADYYQQLFLEKDYFGFEKEKVRFLKEARLPVISNVETGKILLKSPWEVLQSPIGSGGIFMVLSSSGIMDEIDAWGVEYLQVCGLNSMSVAGHLLLLGLAKSKRSDVGFRINSDIGGSAEMEHSFDVVLSVEYLKEIIKNPAKIQLHAVAAQSEHGEFVRGEWVNISPTESNCVRLHSSIYSLLNTSSPDKICILMSSED